MPKQLWVSSKSKLARVLGVTRVTLDRLFTLKGHPIARPNGHHNIADWERFRDANLDFTKQANRKNGASSTNGHHDPAQFSLRTEKEKSAINKNNIAARREAFKLDVEMGEYLPREAVNAEVRTANTIVVREISKAIETELPPRLEGLSAVEIKKQLCKKFAAIFANLHKGFSSKNGTSAA